MNDSVRLIMVGGFLGAGKTTLLWEAARLLSQRGEMVGLITNDQAPGLVDTTFLSWTGSRVEEVAGSCFCCNFEGMIEAVQKLRNDGAGIILAEPVGSCTDLVATIIRPVLQLHPWIELKELSVMADPGRLAEILDPVENGMLHRDAAYILRLQLQEADRIVIGKSDSLSDSDIKAIRERLTGEFPDTALSILSSFSGNGLHQWLADVLTGPGPMKGQRPDSQTPGMDVDYDRYAQGEAVLGWLNAVVTLHHEKTGKTAISEIESHSDCHESSFKLLVENFMSEMKSLLKDPVPLEIGHLKTCVTWKKGMILSNLTALDREPDFRCREFPQNLSLMEETDIKANPEDIKVNGTACATADGLENESASLTINARVQTDPDTLARIVERAIEKAVQASAMRGEIVSFTSLKPGRPCPTHRYGV